MKKRYFIFSASVLLFATLFFFSSHQVSAQVGISLFPIKYRVSINPGTSYSDTITVINPNDFPIGAKPEVENLGIGDEGSIDLYTGDGPYGLEAWIHIDRKTVTLAPHERRQISFSIDIPKNAEPGGHYGAILFRNVVPDGSSLPSGVGISARVGSVVLVEVPGKLFRTGEIASFTGPSGYAPKGPVAFTFKIKNTGNTHFDPQGIITITGPFIKTAKIPFESRIIFPGHLRTFLATWPVRYAFGPITATAEISVGDSGVQTASLTFFMFPWQEASIIIILLAILILGLRNFKKKFKIVKVR